VIFHYIKRRGFDRVKSNTRLEAVCEVACFIISSKQFYRENKSYLYLKNFFYRSP
jgi:hypothetical protein